MNDVDGAKPNDGQVDQVISEPEDVGAVDGDPIERGPVDQLVPAEGGPTPGDVLRALPSEAQQRGTRFVSAQAMQAKLFSVYDAAAAAEDALALVQQQLTLTLNRNYYEADEIESMAAELDALLMLESLDLSEDDLVSED
jgi:hypothetical protein